MLFSTISFLGVTVGYISVTVVAVIVNSDTRSDFFATTSGMTLPQTPELKVTATASPIAPASPSPPSLASLPTQLLSSNRQQQNLDHVRIHTVQGWPTLLEVEVDELELGGLAMPSIQSVIQNLKIGLKNFGNVDAPASFLT